MKSARISEERLLHLEDRSKELTVARARINELEDFVMAEGDCHISNRQHEIDRKAAFFAGYDYGTGWEMDTLVVETAYEEWCENPRKKG